MPEELTSNVFLETKTLITKTVKSMKTNLFMIVTMHADIAGALAQLNTSFKHFEHNGKRLTKDQVKRILEYGLSKGYKTTAELKDDEVDVILAGGEAGPK